jgi:Protein kinase domain/AAA ATPase domain
VVAFKQLRSGETGERRRTLELLFEREYRTLVRLKHPRIIEVYDFGVTPVGPYYTMELLDGQDLQQLAPLPWRVACQHLRDIASSLALLHAQQLVHRDVSPRNVRLTADGRAKLIDFGALSAFGMASQVVGTPPCMAPELLRGLPLDQRSDLFALGAIGYWALTGRHAYPARSLHELPSLWQTKPRPPSLDTPDIPPLLETLILSLLNTEALARPPSAAAVIDQLSSIADLPAEEQEQASEAYLSSGRLVGRAEEQRWLQQHIARAFEGRGAEVIVQGSSGIGKTRLLHEVSLDAQVKGAIAVRAEAQPDAASFSLACAISLQLLAARPELARRCAAQDSSLLAALSPAMAKQLGCGPASLAQDPAERRARFQTALHVWFMRVAAEQTLLVVVDNVELADDSSAAFLAALGHEARHTHLALLVALRSGAQITAAIPFAALMKHAARLTLAGLHLSEYEELVSSLFGGVTNSGRLAKLLYERSAGNPQHCMDLARLLVKKKIAKYLGGVWVLPLEVSVQELPSRIEELVQEKLATLTPAARALCETLSVERGYVSIERCLRLAGGLNAEGACLALDELVAEQMLSVVSGGYGFQRESLRESVLSQIDEKRRTPLHLRAAEALLNGDAPSVESRMQAASHLLDAGEDVRGADMLANAAAQFLRDQGVDGAERVVQAIETAVTLYENQRRSKYEIAGLLFPLMSLAFFVDWRVTLKHGERALRLGLEITGLGLAQKLSRFLPAKLALLGGLTVAAVRLTWQRRRHGLQYGLVDAIGSFCALVPPTIGTQNIVYDLPAVQRVLALLEPLKLFGKNHIACLMYDFAKSQSLMCLGLEDQAVEVLEDLRTRFPAPAIKQVLGDAHWKAMYGGVLFSLGVVYPFHFGQRPLEIALEMEALGVRVWAMAADEVRMLYHAFRGETEEVARYRARVELFALQGSTTWQADIFWPILLLGGELLSGDAIALRTIREQLDRSARNHVSLDVYSKIAHATYLEVRGEHKAAVAAFDAILLKLRGHDDRITWPIFRACSAVLEALNAAGMHARAKELASELLTRAGSQVQRVVGHYLEPQRQLALAEAGLGHHSAAAAALDALLSRFAGESQPLLLGLLHKARAEVALAMHDEAAFKLHFGELDARFRGAKNPGLIALSNRLAKRAVREGLLVSRPPRAPGADASTDISNVLTQQLSIMIRTAADGCATALRILIEHSTARAASLYMFDGQRLDLVASSAEARPTLALEARLLHELQQACLQAQAEDCETQALDAPANTNASIGRSIFHDPATPQESSHGPSAVCGQSVRLLCVRRDDVLAVVGGLILEFNETRDKLDDELLSGIAALLHERAEAARQPRRTGPPAAEVSAPLRRQ